MGLKLPYTARGLPERDVICGLAWPGLVLVLAMDGTKQIGLGGEMAGEPHGHLGWRM